MRDLPHLRATKINALAARRTLRASAQGALGTLDENGAPYTSLVTVSTDPAGAPVLLLSGLADHTKNIGRDSRVSLLTAASDGYANPQEAPRVSVTGIAVKADDDERPALKARFLARHPGAALYADFTDFGFYRIVVERVHFVGGFGRAVWLDGPDVVAAPNLSDAAASMIGRPLVDDWRVTALDADGCDLHDDSDPPRVTRLCFEPPATDADGLETALAALPLDGL